MTKPSKVRRIADFHHHDLPSCRSKMCKKLHQKEKRPKSSEKKEWEGATCSVCMEHPHNAVLLLCSSYDKGCRPYMCATSCRFSNCLEQYKKAYTKVTSIEDSEPGLLSTNDPNCSSGAGCLAGATELLCPLCRGQVKGWTVVEPARKHLNAKKRTCMHENCSFVGTYKKLRKHVRRQHPSARPLEVDPSLAEKWKKLEHERELNDVFSTIRSAMPGAIVMGDYVIDGNFGGLHRNFGLDNHLDETLFRSDPLSDLWNNNVHPDDLFDDSYHSFDQDDFFVHHSGTEAASNVFNRISRLHSRILLGRSRRRQRHRASSRIR
ncbi:uncharacterized protein LOC107026387 [Solanum pennellii]|uniref:Uncharacterized protein LOC107026387 n=1 Tax=Solanum pennellii TaxID=28526 RepID=A0ABM1HAQ3_SOLPN|nr:uncharacterized protein LOC107026387 [Solanum pennellii]